ncbi:MAG TPA: hypothetical protein DCS09_02580 [Porphyromonadaceae bacterium]|nr:hypothetical protein [Porphyromonadaceae bacterium]
MGADPEAIIYYGFPIDKPEFDYFEASEEWKDKRKPKEPEDKGEYRTPEWDEWRSKLREWETTVENIEITWGGAEDCEQFYIHAPALRLSVEWGEQKPLEEVDFSKRNDADTFIELFCKQFGLEYKQPGWHLAARYF